MILNFNEVDTKPFAQNIIIGTGGPRISWFLVPKSNHEMGGSWIPMNVFILKPQNKSKKIL